MPPSELSIEAALRILEIFAIAGGGVMALIRIGRVVQKMEQYQEHMEEALDNQKLTIGEMKEDIKTLNRAMIDIALQKQRLDILDQRYEELRHGRGYVQPQGLSK